MTRGTEAIAYIETEARRLARSGVHHGWRSIESELLERGLAGTRKVFANRWTQFELDRLCEKARAEQIAERRSYRLHFETLIPQIQAVRS